MKVLSKLLLRIVWFFCNRSGTYGVYFEQNQHFICAIKEDDLTCDIYYIQVCCICLGKYANNDELRELPCVHVFHKDCVDKWLKINALCPLCKAEVGGSNSTS